MVVCHLEDQLHLWILDAEAVMWGMAGNKADMVRRLKALLDGSQPLEDKPKPKPAARTPWEEEKGAAEDVPVPSPVRSLAAPYVPLHSADHSFE